MSLASTAGVASLTAAVLFAHGVSAWASPFAAPFVLVALAVVGLVGAWVAVNAPGDMWRERMAGSIVAFVLASTASWSTIWCGEQLAMRQVSLPLIGKAIGLLLSPFGGFGASALGEVRVEARDGCLLFGVTTEKIGLLLLAYVAASLSVSLALSRLNLRRLLAGGVVVVFVVVLRLGLEIALYADIGNVFLSRFPSPLARFGAVDRQMPWMLLLGICLSWVGWRFDSPGRIIMAVRPVRANLGLCLSTGLGVMVAMIALQVRLPSRVSQGTVVIDDFHSEFWASAGRRMNTDWYGDFSTYNLGAITEYLGHFYALSVNRNKRYAPGSLDAVDVLVLKTPTVDFEVEEVETILDFVQRGGGLVLIGDHTNLLGMSSRLNQFAVPAGIAFVFDGVSDGDSGAFSFAPSPTVSHPTRSVGACGVQFMTGCSLRMAQGVDALLVAPGSMRVLGDYANGSFFGTLHNDPRTDIAPVAHAAAGRFGDGTVLAYSDSTCLSSFGVFQYERADFMVRAIDFCARGGMSHSRWRWAALALGVMAAGTSLVSLLRTSTRSWQAAGLGVGIGVAILANTLVGAIHHRCWPEVCPCRRPTTVAYVSANTNGLMPPVLGTARPEWLPHSYDTLFAAVPRTGRFPKLIGGINNWDGRDPLIFIEPAHPLSPEQSKRFFAKLSAGGRALVAVASNEIGFETMKSLLVGPTLSIEFSDEVARKVRFIKGPDDTVQSLAGGRIQLYETQVGEGRILLVVGVEHWAREKLGHAFAIPDAGRADLYESLYRVLDRLGPQDVERRTYLIK